LVCMLLLLLLLLLVKGVVVAEEVPIGVAAFDESIELIDGD